MIRKLQAHRPNRLRPKAIDLVFIVLFMLQITCIGAMLLVAFFVRMEQQSLLQTEVQKSPSQFAPNRPF